MNKSHILTKASFVFANLMCILCFNKIKKTLASPRIWIYPIIQHFQKMYGR